MAEIEFGTFEQDTTNPYDDVIAQMIERGEDTSVTLTLDEDKFKRETHKFRKAANAADKSARLRTKEEDGDTIRVTFTIGPRHKPRRRKGDTETVAAEGDE